MQTCSLCIPHQKVITSYNMWLSAWCNYEGWVVSHGMDSYTDMARYLCCIEYRCFIHDCQAKFSWPAVLTYDVTHRMRLSKRHSFNLATIDIPLFMMTFAATTPRKGCFRCGQAHFVKHCPFPMGPPVGAQSKNTKTDATPAVISFACIYTITSCCTYSSDCSYSHFSELIMQPICMRSGYLTAAEFMQWFHHMYPQCLNKCYTRSSTAFICYVITSTVCRQYVSPPYSAIRHCGTHLHLVNVLTLRWYKCFTCITCGILTKGVTTSKTFLMYCQLFTAGCEGTKL